MTAHRDGVLEAFSNVVAAVVDGKPRDEVLDLVVTSLRQFADCDLAAVTVAHPEGGLVTLVADGAEAELYRGRRFDGATTSTARVIETGEPVVVDNVSANPTVAAQTPGNALGPSIFMPLFVDGPTGSLSATRFLGKPAFTQDEIDLVRSFSLRASLVLQQDCSRRRRLALERVAEQTQIAADLQDSAVESIFSTSLLLSGLVNEVSDPLLRERLVFAIDRLDDSVKLIRQVAFGLVERTRSTQEEQFEVD